MEYFSIYVNNCLQLTKCVAYAMQLKGLGVSKSNTLDLISDIIRDQRHIPCAALMAAKLAPEVSKEYYCEATIGSKDKGHGVELKKLFQTSYFRMVVIKGEVGCELRGALKNIVAVGHGFSGGLVYGVLVNAFFKERDFQATFHKIYRFATHVIFLPNISRLKYYIIELKMTEILYAVIEYQKNVNLQEALKIIYNDYEI